MIHAVYMHIFSLYAYIVNPVKCHMCHQDAFDNKPPQQDKQASQRSRLSVSPPGISYFEFESDAAHSTKERNGPIRVTSIDLLHARASARTSHRRPRCRALEFGTIFATEPLPVQSHRRIIVAVCVRAPRSAQRPGNNRIDLLLVRGSARPSERD